MFAFLLAIIMSLTPGDMHPGSWAHNDGPQTYRVTITETDEQPGEIKVITQPAAPVYLVADKPERNMFVQNDSYIGVRITAIPEPLAAHIGDHGVMIGNLTEDGPADQAGIQRYDIVVKYDDEDVAGVSDLTSAIASAGHDQSVNVVVIRNGQPLTVKLKPAPRPDEMRWTWKFDEPEDVFAGDAIKFRGRALQKGPQGEWIMRDLGKLEDLPESLGKLDKLFEDLDIDVDIEVPPPPQPPGSQDHQQSPPGSQGHGSFGKSGKNQTRSYSFFGDGSKTGTYRLFGGDAKGGYGSLFGKPDKAQKRVTIKTDQKGAQRALNITIEQTDDGITTLLLFDGDEYRVTRTDNEGNETTKVYDTLDELENDDPEAAELLGEHEMTFVPKSGSESMIFVQPFGQEARKLRKEYQIDVEKKLRKALEEAERSRAEAQHRAQEAYRQAVEAQRQAEKEVKKQIRRQRKLHVRQQPDAGQPLASQELIGVRVDADGQVTVYLRMAADEIARITFNSESDFKAAEPELYEQARPMFD